MPVSTYRLQLTKDFGFAEAAGIAGYLADLGITHVYLSPVLQAVPGSAHGYDITDHSRVRAEFGGEDGFRAMARVLRRHGIGIVLDIVPNHMAVPAPESLNRQLWSVLRDGPGAPHANWFDIDWAARGGRMLLPILAGPPEQCRDDLAVDPAGPGGEPVVRYFDHVLPLRPGTARLPLADLLAAQHYELADWRTAATDLNWRRFFDVTSLIGVRVEDPAVFNATHEVTARLIGEGLIDGLRVDHPDGLADPRGYLRRLADLTGGRWLVAEKILAWGERLPPDWPCAGTTGYDALGLAGGLFVDPAAADALTSACARFARRADDRGVAARFADVATVAKREVAGGPLAAEVARLARLLTPGAVPARASRGMSGGSVPPGTPPDPREGLSDMRTVLTEVLAAFGVYRAYADDGEPPSAASVAAVRSAVAAARRRLPQRLHVLADTVGDLALDGSQEFSTRFQQTTGPVLAKGVEDTAFYRWPRLIALNEVGGDPDRLGVSPAGFHAEAARLAADWPATMTTLSTHDTKRQEDVRARLAVLAEIPGEWGRRVAAWHERAVSPRAYGDDAPAVEPQTEYLIWQTLIGAWPLSGGRLTGYLTKAIREAKARTSWIAPDPRYEAAVLGLAARILGDADLSADIAAFVAQISADALANSLGAKLVQLTMPGVADMYQGSELTALGLVDPDNRHSVDYARRRELLAEADAAGGPPPSGPGRRADPDSAKLLVTCRALRLRRDHPGWFVGGDYHPLTVTGPAAQHAVAFGRGKAGLPGALTVVTRLPAGLRRRGGWADTALTLPDTEATWTDLLTGNACRGERVPLRDLTRRLPVALLVSGGGPRGPAPPPWAGPEGRS